MSWNGVITNAGAAILELWESGGHTLTIDGATVGSGYVSAVNMRNAVDLQHQEDTASIIQAEAVDGGTRFKVQVLAAETAYVAHEIGIWAHIDSGSSIMIALHQDTDTGVSVPDVDTSPDFAFALFCVHAISNTAEIEISIDPSVMVTQSTIGSLIDLETTSKTTIVDAINEVAAKVKNISDAYSSSSTYKVGQICIYDNTLYKCNTAITTAEEWTAAHWTATTIAEEIENRVLWFPGATVSATTGNIVAINDSRITAAHVLARCEFTNNSNITALSSWSTETAGTFTISGTCTAATTADILLVRKD